MSRSRRSHRRAFSFSASETLVPSSPADLVRDHREHYLQRKLARSPLLNFMPGAYRIDACSLFDGVTPNAPAIRDSGVSTPTGLVSALIGPRGEAVIYNARSTIIQKLNKIRRSADDSRHSTGQHALYLGYPCVVLPGDRGKTKFSPIFLFAIEIVATPQKITIRRRGENGADDNAPSRDDALFNRLFAAFVQHEHRVKLEASEARFEIDPDNIEAQVNRIFVNWKQVAYRWEYPAANRVITKEELKQLTSGTDDPCIVDHAVIGLADFSGQSLLDDLDRIEADLRGGTPCSEPLKKLLENRNFDAKSATRPPSDDLDKWLVEKSDPSQEEVIWSQRHSPLVVLQGPPGTGKSQTIVNTIADAVAAKQTVLVVCQKRAATEVVRKRLDAVGLGELCSLVDDVDKDRAAILKRIRDVETEFPETIWDKSRRDQLARDICDAELKLEAGANALSDDAGGSRRSHGDLLALLSDLNLFDPNPEWSTDLLLCVNRLVDEGLDNAQLEKFVQRVRQIDEKANSLRYGKNLWSKIEPALASDAGEIDGIQKNIRTVMSSGRRIASGALTLQHDHQTQWVAEHPWFSAPSTLERGLPYFSRDDDSKRNSQEFNRWLTALREVAIRNDIVRPEQVSRDARSGMLDMQELERIATDSADVGEIAALRAEIHSVALFRATDESLMNHVSRWEPQLKAALLHRWKQLLLQTRKGDFQHARNIPALCTSLSRYLIEKRSADVLDILTRYNARIPASDWLKQNDLLRLRRSGPTPKTSLRRLHHRGAEQLQKLQPVLLTNPETASSLLPLKLNHYDLVVIDEASQMFVAEAIPMLFRARRALIAGDRQQMPPSNHFAFGDDDDDLEQDIIDDDAAVIPVAAAEGIYRLLDAAEEALGTRSPSRRTLEIHYRSARKELIDFSNHAFYEGKLIIPSGNAPLPAFLRTAIEFDQVDGVFSRGLNEIEARRIVDRIAEIFRIPQSDRPTLGVIVNNIKQKARIEELLVERGDLNKAFEDTYASEREREVEGEDVSFFVRSVEHVQGDERDVIIFGATYAGSSRGFGPLTATEDGRKRLNVAVTRAKRGMIVLCSLNTSHTSNEAEKTTHERYFLWQYLRYARAVAHNDRSMVNTVLNQLNPDRESARRQAAATESPFEDEVKQFIENAGYFVEPQIGESGFRIDLGVRDGANDLNFLCGIECDGAPYHTGWSARTRDVWRQEILESKGWVIHRIWSTQWYENPARTKETLLKQLQSLRDSYAQLSPQASRESASPPVSNIAHPTVQSHAKVATVPPAVRPVVTDSKPLAQQESLLETSNEQIAVPPSSPRLVAIGDTVEYMGTDKIPGKVKIIRGVGEFHLGTISASTPLAKALIDSAEDEEITYESPMGPVQLTIRRVHKI